MSPFLKKFNRLYGKVLLRIAEGDLNSARILAEHPGGRPENTVYLLQQAVEKTLKAVLCHCDLAVPLTHDIAALLAALPEKISRPPGETDLVSLTEYAMVRRYEEGFYEITVEEVKAATEATSKVIVWAKTIVN